MDHFLISNSKTSDDVFLGYVFEGAHLRHWSTKPGNTDGLFKSYSSNCGVFACLKNKKDKTVVFSDPLAQFPIFFYSRQETFIVSTDLYALSNELEKKSLNSDCVNDYIAYFHPLNHETLVSGVKRLKPYEYIEVTDGNLSIKKMKAITSEAPYRELLAQASTNLKSRARALLDFRPNPIVHLSGGADSRLALGGLLSQGFHGSVFSFGDGKNQDRLISHRLAEKHGLSETPIKWWGKSPKTIPHMQRAIRPFNAMKVMNPVNYSDGNDFSYSEVTGYFSGGLLKSSGSSPFSDGASMFRYARTVSAFNAQIFDSAERRATDSANNLLIEANGHEVFANSLFYLQNRSAGHFGAHSVVSNSRFVSVDLIYDPLLPELVRAAPYTAAEINLGAIVIDLIKETAGRELATFPYENRLIPRYADWTQNTEGETCFSPAPLGFPANKLKPLEVEIHGEVERLTGPLLDEVDDIFEHIVSKDFPLLKSVRPSRRGGEQEAKRILLCIIDDLFYS